MNKKSWLSWFVSRFPLLLICGVFAGLNSGTALSQSPFGIELFPPETNAYPLISATFTASDTSGQMIDDIQSEEINVYENDRAIKVNQLELIDIGVRLSIAFNEGPTIANHYNGVSRFDSLKKNIFDWINTHQENSMDEFSLFTSYGSLNLDVNDPKTWVYSLQAYQPDLRNAQSDIRCLSDAIDNALNSASSGNKKAAILFITPLPTSAQFVTIKELIDRAQQNDVRVFIWLVGPQDYAGADNARLLNEYAQQTGGQYFLFSGVEPLPALMTWLDPLRYKYKLTYTTEVKSQGEFSLMVKLIRDGLTLESNPVSFSLNVQPPNPIFLTPPNTITRSWTKEKDIKESVLIPEVMQIQSMLEFADGMPRELEYSRLFVDNQLEDENTAEPFDLFTWDLSKYVTSGSHSMQIVIQDIAGIKGETILLPVEVMVEEKPMTWWQKLQENINTLTLIIGGVLLLMFISAVVAVTNLIRKRKRAPKKPRRFDPVTQAVDIDGEFVLPPRASVELIEWPVIRGVGLAPARFVHKSLSIEDPAIPAEIPLKGDEISIGSERKKVDVVITHTTVSPLHANLFKDADGDFRVADAGSEAGTWVNYAPVSTHGIKLEHGDLVQFGRVGFVFELQGAQPKRIQVLPYPES